MHEITPVVISNLTATALLKKAGLTSLADTITQAQTDQRKIEDALKRDQTRTEHAANIEALKHSEKQFSKVSKQIENIFNGLGEKYARLDSKVQPYRSIKGTTDMLILGQYIPVLTTKTEILRVAATDQDGARAALLSPIIKHKINLSTEAIAAVNEHLNRHVLGSEYPDFQKASDDMTTVAKAGDLFNEGLPGVTKRLEVLQKDIIDPALLEV